jgi:GT2 family glycosyltransferase
MSIKDITVIITSFRSGEKIKTCLNSIDRQTKIILVENSNDSKIKNNIEKEFSNVECILTGSNLGYGKANNIGLRKTTTKFALILNPDATLHQSTLNNFLKTVEKIPKFAIMAPYTKGEKNNLKNSDPIETINVKGFAMFLNLSEFKDIGFFDEDFFFYFEEIDLCKRLINHGKKIYLVPDIKINHGGGRSHEVSINDEMELSRNWHWMWSTFNYHKKYKGFFISFLIVLPKLSSAIIKVLIYSLFFNKKKKEIYYQRLSGLINAILGRNSWYRPKV